MACARRVSVSELLGDAEQRYFGEGFRAAQQSLTQVKLERGSDNGYRDIGASYALSPTFVNCILGQTQVSQLMLHSLDHIDRSFSGNLWMRHVELITHGPQLHHETDFDAEARTSRTQLLPMNGHTWRVTDFVGRFAHIAARHNLATLFPHRKVLKTNEDRNNRHLFHRQGHYALRFGAPHVHFENTRKDNARTPAGCRTV